MRRRAWAALVLAGTALVGVPAAEGAPRPLERADESTAFALAGEEYLVGRARGRTARVLGRRLTGGGRPALRFRFRAPRGQEPEPRIAASPTTAGVVVVTESEERAIHAAQAFAGPLAGPWAALGPFRELRGEEFFPVSLEVDGERTIATEFRVDLSQIRHIVREPGREPIDVRLAEGAIPWSFAGDLVAFAVPPPGQSDEDEPRQVVVRDWRARQDRWRVTISQGVDNLDLHPDGRVVVEDDTGGVVEVAAGGAGVRRLAREGSAPGYAGDRVVFVREGPRDIHRLAIVEPDGRVRPFGVPSAAFQGYDADDRRVVWNGHGCLLVSELADAAAEGPAPGPCPRAELAIRDDRTHVIGPSRRLRVAVRCVAAPPPGCRGTLRLRYHGRRVHAPASRRVRFRVPTGAGRRVPVRLTARGYRNVRRQHREEGVVVDVRTVTVDPAGRRSVLDRGLTLETRR